MIRPLQTGLVIMGVVGAAVLLGCQSRPVVPTVAPEPTEEVIVIVVTATSQPTLAPTNTVAPTITPLPTLTPIITETITATIQARVGPTRPSTPVPTSAPPTLPIPTAQITAVPPTPLTLFPAPVAIAPEGKKFRDGDTVTLEFQSVGPLAGDQCYKFDMTLINPGNGEAGDNWVGLCGNQTAAGSRLIFKILPGRFRNDPNYGTVLAIAESLGPAEELEMRWTVTVVRNLGLSADGVHYTVEGISPPSQPLMNTFFR